MENQTKPNRFKYIVILLVIVVIVIVIVGNLVLNRNSVQASKMDITAEFVDQNNIELTGKFTITGVDGLTSDQLATRIAIEPTMEFSVKKDEQAGQFALQTYLPLEGGKQIDIIFTDNLGKEQRRWIFTTEDSFKVINSFPTNGATNVSLRTAIELSLSYGDIELEKLDDYIKLSVDAEIDYMMRKNILVLTVRNQDWPTDSLIEVIVSGELPRKSGGKLGQDYKFSFTTGSGDTRENVLSSMNARITENVPPGEEVLLKLKLGESLIEKPLATTIYKYTDSTGYYTELNTYLDEMVWRQYNYNKFEWYSNDSWQADSTGLEEVVKFSSIAVSDSDNNGDRFVLVPQPLEQGWYMAKVEATLDSGETVSATKLIQISPVSVYYAQPTNFTEKDQQNTMIAWVNSTQTGKPVEKAEVSINAANYKAKGKTDGDGLAQLQGTVQVIDRRLDYMGEGLPYTDVVGILSVANGEDVFYDVYSNSFSQKPRNVEYMQYLFSDRPVYRHTDTIKIWGLLKPRLEGTELPKGLYLSAEDDIIKVPITLEQDGTFQTEFNIEATSGDYLDMTIMDEDGTKYDDSWIGLRVKLQDYIKPIYLTTASQGKPVYTEWGDNSGGVDINFTANYFEGTPAQQYQAVVKIPNEEAYSYTPMFESVSITTDEQGNASATIYPIKPHNENDFDTWRPLNVDYGVFSDQELNSPQQQGGFFYYIYRDTMLTLDKGKDGKSVTMQVNKVDISNIKQEADLLVLDNLKGTSVDTALTVEIHKEYFKKTVSGERYDAINKTSVSAYTSELADEIVETKTVNSKNGVAILSNLPNDDKLASYYLKVTLADSRGKNVMEKIYYSQYSDDMRIGQNHNFVVKKREYKELPKLKPWEYYDPQFEDGETMEFYLTDNGEDISNKTGKMLYIASQNGIVDYGVTDLDSARLSFEEKYVPNFMVCGGYFDGKFVYATNYSYNEYNPEKRELAIDISPSKDSYNPDDSADISFSVTDKTTGKPSANTKLVAAVVDEAVFAIEEQTPDFLKKLYKSVSTNWVNQYTSYDNHDTGDDGRGAGGPNQFVPRVDFKDTAAFVVLTTDENGKAKLDVPLPDNLTSWRVTALAFSNDKKAGDTKDNFTVSKDFFITPTLPPRLLYGDDLVITVRSAGRTTTTQDIVEYSCTLTGYDKTITAQGMAGQPTVISIPQELLPQNALDIGSYSITISGKKGEQTDAITLPLEVVKSGINVSVSGQVPLDQLSTQQSTTWPVTVGFYDKKYQLQTNIISFLARNQGIRADQRIAHRLVMERMRDAGIQPSMLDNAALVDSIEDLCQDQKAYSLFPYSESSLTLTARIKLDLSEQDYHAYPLTESLAEIETEKDTHNKAALTLIYAEDLSKKTQIITDQLDGSVSTFKDKMYLITALANAGKPELAKEWYQKLATPALKKQTDANGDDLIMVERDGTVNVDDTAGVCTAAIQLGLEDADGLVRFLLTDPVSDDLYLLELVHYMRKQTPQQGGVANVSYTVDGKNQTLPLKNGMSYRSFSKSQLANAVFTVGENVWADVLYTQALEQAQSRDNQKLTLSKTIESVDGKPLQQGSVAKITLSFSVPTDVVLDKDTGLVMQDYVPTGMRYESLEGKTGWYVGTRNDQRINFTSVLKNAGSIVYYARCVAPGNYIGESAFISVTGGSVWGMSERQEVHIDLAQQ